MGAFAGSKCADGVEAAEDEYEYQYYYYGIPFGGGNYEAEVVDMANACGLTVVSDLGDC